MPVSIYQWRAATGLFGVHRCVPVNQKRILKYSNLKALTILLILYGTITFLLVVQDGNIKISPGHKPPLPPPPQKQQKIFHVDIGMSTAYWLITKYDC